MDRRFTAEKADALRKVLRRHPEVDAAFLFGSAATGSARKDSDIDIALMGNGQALDRIRLDMMAALASEGLKCVDLVILENASLLLRFEALRHNRLLYRRNEEVDTSDLFSRTLRQYWDFQPLLMRRALLYREKLLHGAA